MTLNQYYLKYGTKGLELLAERSVTKLSYLKQLNYVVKKMPSLELAKRLVAQSDGELTLDGLANPVKVLVRDAKAAGLCSQS